MRRKGVNKQSYFNFIEPDAIMGVIVSLIILAVGVFAFFVTVEQIDLSVDNSTADSSVKNTTGNVSDTASELFNIIGIVLIIGAIMTVVGLMYSYIGNFHSTPRRKKVKRKPVNDLKQIEKERKASEKTRWKDEESFKEKPKKKKDGWQI